MVKVIVEPGVCGFKTEISVSSEDMQYASVKINTGCPNFKGINDELKEIDAYRVCFSKMGESDIYDIVKKYCPHAACPIPTGIIKGIEVACNLALPKDVHMSIEKI